MKSMKQIKNAKMMQSIMQLPIIRKMLLLSFLLSGVFTLFVMIPSYAGFMMICGLDLLTCQVSFALTTGVVYFGIASMLFMGIALGTMLAEVFLQMKKG